MWREISYLYRQGLRAMVRPARYRGRLFFAAWAVAAAGVVAVALDFPAGAMATVLAPLLALHGVHD
jgi:hypothetical protein